MKLLKWLSKETIEDQIAEARELKSATVFVYPTKSCWNQLSYGAQLIIADYFFAGKEVLIENPYGWYNAKLIECYKITKSYGNYFLYFTAEFPTDKEVKIPIKMLWEAVEKERMSRGN